MSVDLVRIHRGPADFAVSGVVFRSLTCRVAEKRCIGQVQHLASAGVNFGLEKKIRDVNFGGSFS
jgi:hypothetical protein